MSTTTGLIIFGILAVLALGLFLLAARNWSKATALSPTPMADAPPHKDESHDPQQAPLARQSVTAEEAAATPEQEASDPAPAPPTRQVEEKA